jgi:hypothetical protein
VDIHSSTTRRQIAGTTHYDMSAGLSHGRISFRDLRHLVLSAVFDLARKARARHGCASAARLSCRQHLADSRFLEDRFHFLDSPRLDAEKSPTHNQSV